MPTDATQQIAALELRLAALEQATQLITQGLNNAKEREQLNNAQVRDELNKIKERALKRSETLCPQFFSPFFNGTASGSFSAVPTLVINRDMGGSMPLALPHGARLSSISTKGLVTEASLATRIHLHLKLLQWLADGPEPHVTVAEFEIQTGAGHFSGGSGVLNVIIDTSASYYDLELNAHWDEPQTAESDSPTVRFYVIELAYAIPEA